MCRGDLRSEAGEYEQTILYRGGSSLKSTVIKAYPQFRLLDSGFDRAHKPRYPKRDCILRPTIVLFLGTAAGMSLIDYLRRKVTLHSAKP